MRSLLAIAVSFACAGWAAAQSFGSNAQAARPVAGAPVLVTDRESFPRQIERGEVIVELRIPALETRRFVDAYASEQSLERMTLGDGNAVFCGAAMPSAAQAAQVPQGMALRPTCFRDSDNDGAADQVFSILSGLPRFGVTLFGAGAIAARPWEAGAINERRVQYRYAGAQAGRILDAGRLGEGVIEVNVVTSTSASAQGSGETQSNEKMFIGCLGDGRCVPLPASMDPIIALANPTVEGSVEARIVGLPDAIAISAEVNAMAARQAAREAQKHLPTSPASRMP